MFIIWHSALISLGYELKNIDLLKYNVQLALWPSFQILQD